MSKETVKQYIRNQYTGKEQCQFLPQMNQQDSLAHSSLKNTDQHYRFLQNITSIQVHSSNWWNCPMHLERLCAFILKRIIILIIDETDNVTNNPISSGNM